MQFGMQFFPDVKPAQKSAAQYFDEALRLVDFCDAYGYTHVRIVEHYFHHWGGYSPNPAVFLTAATHRTRRARLVSLSLETNGGLCRDLLKTRYGEEVAA